MPIQVAGLERLKCDVRVAKILKAYFVKIVSAYPDVKILPPIIINPLVGDHAAGLELFDAIGPRSDRRFEGGCSDTAPVARLISRLPPVPGQNGELSHNLRQLAISP